MDKKLCQISLIIFCLVAFWPPNGIAQNIYNDPWDKMARWKTSVRDGSGCPTKIDAMAQQLSKIKDCDKWANLWIRNMDCAVRTYMGPGAIAYCWTYNNDIEGANRFYKKLRDEYGERACLPDPLGEGLDVTCRNVARKLVMKDYSHLPTDPDKMVRKMLYALQNGNHKEILEYLEQNQRVYNHDGEGRAKFDKYFLRNHPPKSLEILYIGKRKEDRAWPRREGDPVYPCVASGLWGKWRTVNFMVYEKPLRKDQPRRYSFRVSHGGCEQADAKRGYTAN